MLGKVPVISRYRTLPHTNSGVVVSGLGGFLKEFLITRLNRTNHLFSTNQITNLYFTRKFSFFTNFKHFNYF